MLALPVADKLLSEDLYDEMDNTMSTINSMDILFFGPPSSFIRMDAETVIHILAHSKKNKLPMSMVLLAWDIVTDGKTSAYLQSRELIAFGSLLNKVPEEDLYYLNFGDQSVFRYFTLTKVDVNDRTFGILIAAYRRYFGDNFYKFSKHINDLGYLLCGFPSADLKKISPTTFKGISADVLNKLHRCNVEQLQILYKIAIHPDAYGEPYTWTSYELGKLNTVITCIPRNEISSLRLEAMPAISTHVMRNINQKTLCYFSVQQISKMNSKTRRIFILRMQLKNSLDTSQVKSYASNIYPCVTLIVLFIFFDIF